MDYANARAEVVRARVAVDDAQNQMDDTNVRAPITGTIIEKLVERGQVRGVRGVEGTFSPGARVSTRPPTTSCLP